MVHTEHKIPPLACAPTCCTLGIRSMASIAGLNRSVWLLIASSIGVLMLSAFGFFRICTTVSPSRRVAGDVNTFFESFRVAVDYCIQDRLTQGDLNVNLATVGTSKHRNKAHQPINERRYGMKLAGEGLLRLHERLTLRSSKPGSASVCLSHVFFNPPLPD